MQELSSMVIASSTMRRLGAFFRSKIAVEMSFLPTSACLKKPSKQNQINNQLPFPDSKAKKPRNSRIKTHEWEASVGWFMLRDQCNKMTENSRGEKIEGTDTEERIFVMRTMKWELLVHIYMDKLPAPCM